MHIRYICASICVLGCAASALAQPLTTVFTYQGELNSSGIPAGGLHDLRFRLFDAVTLGSPVGSTLCANNVSVTDGRFTASLDFGAQFAGQQRFLEVQVRADTGLGCGDATGYTTLLPRQPLTAAPYAVFALNAAAAASATTAATATNTTQLNGQSASFYQNAANLSSGTIPSARLSGAYSGVLTLSNAANVFIGAGAGLTGVNAELLDGLNSTAFLQSVPSPLTLSGTSATHIIGGVNASTASGSIGVFGTATAFTGETYGVYGTTASTSGRGVLGVASATFGPTEGLYGVSNSSGGRGAVGWATAPSGITYGVFGLAESTGGTAVFGHASATSGATFGGYFESASTTGRGVHGRASAASAGITFGVYGESASADGRGVYGRTTGSFGMGVFGEVTNEMAHAVAGSNNSSGYGVYAIGRLGATGTKSFRIDHPDDPANKYLLHYAAESPEVINFYSGKVALDAAGQAVVEMPHYFAKINKDPRYTLTAVGAAMPLLHIAVEIDESALSAGARSEPGEAAPLCSFRIAGGAPGAKVSWRVEAVRNDRYVQKRGAPVEVEKQGREKGTYQHPDLYGQPPERGMHYDATRRHPEPALPEPIAAAAPR